MLSTTKDGKVVKGLAGVPLEGTVLYVGYHMLLGLEVIPLVSEFLTQRNILLRGIAHPLLFERLREACCSLEGWALLFTGRKVQGFVRMAARFGAKVVAFVVVGADDFAEVIFYYSDQTKIPYFRDFIEDLTEEAVLLRNEGDGEVSNQQLYQP
ncbi:hypothetical protein SLEP1_g58293 [Rubroshorea leprosula]|uniref:Uncharacterized protein n=2 Tax=Rubroshorea leprosula TaxID=152421 RepID=A0AAV5MQ28_9ROSI|nr:hypothetical protein SLEP1_g58293 [Rubroshorea leprosula]